MRAVLVGLQAATYIGLGAVLLCEGEWRLAVAQLLLAVVTGVVYA